MNSKDIYKHNGKILTLTQEAFLSGTNESPIYEGRAKDSEGNIYLIIWQIKQYYIDNPTELDDESNACDWDDYIVQEI